MISSEPSIDHALSTLLEWPPELLVRPSKYCPIITVIATHAAMHPELSVNTVYLRFFVRGNRDGLNIEDELREKRDRAVCR